MTSNYLQLEDNNKLSLVEESTYYKIFFNTLSTIYSYWGFKCPSLYSYYIEYYNFIANHPQHNESYMHHIWNAD